MLSKRKITKHTEDDTGLPIFKPIIGLDAPQTNLDLAMRVAQSWLLFIALEGLLYLFTSNLVYCVGLAAVWAVWNYRSRQGLIHVLKAGLSIPTTLFDDTETVTGAQISTRRCVVPVESNLQFKVFVKDGNPVDVDFFTPQQFQLFEVTLRCSSSTDSSCSPVFCLYF